MLDAAVAASNIAVIITSNKLIFGRASNNANTKFLGQGTLVLEKYTGQAGNNFNSQGVDIGVIFVYIVIGIAVLTATVVFIIIRKKQRNNNIQTPVHLALRYRKESL